MRNITTLSLTVGLSILILISCNNSSNNKTSEKDLELQKRELDLKQKELELKEKQLSIDSIQKSTTPKTSQTAQTEKTQPAVYNTETFPKSDYSNLSDFWKDFKNAAIAKDYKKVAELTAFPFLSHGYYIMSKTEFKSFTFPDYIINTLKTAKMPVKSLMEFGGGTDSNGNLVKVNFAKGKIYEVDCGGPDIYFSKVGGEWRFVAILYGE